LKGIPDTDNVSSNRAAPRVGVPNRTHRLFEPERDLAAENGTGTARNFAIAPETSIARITSNLENRRVTKDFPRWRAPKSQKTGTAKKRERI
jgi:hypothetical protein